MGELRRVVDLDAVLEGELVVAGPAGLALVPTVVVDAPPPHRLEDSPLHGRTRLSGRIVTDPVEVAAIAARARVRRPWWSRLGGGR